MTTGQTRAEALIVGSSQAVLDTRSSSSLNAATPPRQRRLRLHHRPDRSVQARPGRPRRAGPARQEGRDSGADLRGQRWGDLRPGTLRYPRPDRRPGRGRLRGRTALPGTNTALRRRDEHNHPRPLRPVDVKVTVYWITEMIPPDPKSALAGPAARAAPRQEPGIRGPGHRLAQRGLRNRSGRRRDLVVPPQLSVRR